MSTTWRRGLVACFAWLILVAALAAQEREPSDPTTTKPETSSSKSESSLTKAERELARRLVEREKAQDAVVEATKSLEEARGRLVEANAGDDDKAKEKADAAVKDAAANLQDAQAELESAKQFADQAQEALELAKREDELQRRNADAASERDVASPFDSVLKRLEQAKNAREEAELAKQIAASLRKDVDLLQTRLNRVRRESDEVQKKLSMHGGLSEESRANLWSERQQLTDESRQISDQMLALREEMLMAEATAKAKESQAVAEERELGRWWHHVLRLVGVFVAVLLTMLVLRFVVNRRISDPQRRYYLNKVLSLITALACVVGLVIVFADQYQNLLTLFGLSVAGLTIALQELVASFAAWFFIKGARGYRTGDWIAIGDQQGEVVDINFSHTTLMQCVPLDDRATISGSFTGGLVVLMNNQIFKQPLVNYTRGFPYVWCWWAYTVTYESDWEKARDLMHAIATEEAEIQQTARQALTQIQQMASELSIQADSTDPVVRTWAAANGVDLTLRFLIHPRRRPTIQDRINSKILRAVQQSGGTIDFAYNTIREIRTPPSAPPTNSSKGTA